MAGLTDPATAREAWERGREDGERYAADPDAYRYGMPDRSRLFGAFAGDWRAGFNYGRAQHARGRRRRVVKAAPRSVYIPGPARHAPDGCLVCRRRPVPPLAEFFCSDACERRYMPS